MSKKQIYVKYIYDNGEILLLKKGEEKNFLYYTAKPTKKLVGDFVARLLQGEGDCAPIHEIKKSLKKEMIISILERRGYLFFEE